MFILRMIHVICSTVLVSVLFKYMFVNIFQTIIIMVCGFIYKAFVYIYVPAFFFMTFIGINLCDFSASHVVECSFKEECERPAASTVPAP